MRNKKPVNINLDPEEIAWAKADAPRGNVSQYIGDLIRRAHEHENVSIPKVGRVEYISIKEELDRR